MNKNTILEFINKYKLGGEIKSVLWKIDNGILSTESITGDKSALIKIHSNKNVFPKSHNSKSAVYNTPNLERLLSPLDDTISIKVDKNKMVFKDTDLSSQYILSNLSVIPQPPALKNLPNTWEKDFVFDNSIVHKFIKASNSSTDWETFTIFNDKVVLGYSRSLTNRIELPLSFVQKSSIHNKKWQGSLSFNLSNLPIFLKLIVIVMKLEFRFHHKDL